MDKLCQGDKLCLEGIYRQGFGIVPKFVMHDLDLTLESKAIYAYLCALAGSGDTTFPYRDTILRHLGLSKNTYYRHYRLLLDQGYLSVGRPPDKSDANIYTLVQNPKKLPEVSAEGEPGRLRYRGLKAHGYGALPRAVMTDEGLSIKAKGLYAYFCSYCGGGDCAFPRREDILFHLDVSEPTYYKILNQLKDAGYLEIVQRKDNGRFAVNDYFLNDGLNPHTTRGQVTCPPEMKASCNAAEGLRVIPEIKQDQSAPFKEARKSGRQKTGARHESGIMPPCPKNWDIRNGDTIFGYIKNGDANINNSNSNNSLSINSPSTVGDDGRTRLQASVEKLMEELLTKPPRKNREAAVAAREYLVLVWDDRGEEGLARLLEEFIPHLEKGLRDKQVRNLNAYCKAALYNWLAEQPVREETRAQQPAPGAAASYDLGALERFVESGAQLDLVSQSQ